MRVNPSCWHGACFKKRCLDNKDYAPDKAKPVVRRGRKAAGLQEEDSRVATMQMEAEDEKVFQHYRVAHVDSGSGCG